MRNAPASENAAAIRCLKCKPAPMQALCTPTQPELHPNHSRPALNQPSPSYVANSSKGRAARHGRAGPPSGLAPRASRPPRTTLPSPGASTHTRPADWPSTGSERFRRRTHGPRSRARAATHRRDKRHAARPDFFPPGLPGVGVEVLPAPISPLLAEQRLDGCERLGRNEARREPRHIGLYVLKLGYRLAVQSETRFVHAVTVPRRSGAIPEHWRRPAGSLRSILGVDERRTLDELDPPAWDASGDATALVKRCHELRRTPLSDFTVEDLRVMIGQEISLIYLVPRAIEVIEANALAEGDFYPGDLLHALVRVRDGYWQANPDAVVTRERSPRRAGYGARLDQRIAPRIQSNLPVALSGCTREHWRNPLTLRSARRWPVTVPQLRNPSG